MSNKENEVNPDKIKVIQATLVLDRKRYAKLFRAPKATLVLDRKRYAKLFRAPKLDSASFIN